MKTYKILSLLMAITIMSGCSEEIPDVEKKSEKLEVITISQKQITDKRSVTAEITPKSQSVVRARSAGRVEEWIKNVGDFVVRDESVVKIGSDLSIETQRDLDVAYLDLNSAQQNLELTKSQNIGSIKMANSALQNAKDRMELAQRSMTEVLNSIKNQKSDLERTISLSATKSINTKKEILNDLSKFIDEDSILSGEYTSLRRQAIKYSYEDMQKAKLLLSQAQNSSPRMGNNEDMLRDLLAEDQNISLLLSHTLTVLNNTIPSSKDKTIHSTLITKFKSNQTTIDSDLVSYSSLLDNWNKLNTSTSSSQESAFIEVQKSKRAYEQALEDYSTANEASKLSSQTANLRIQQASYGLQSARRNSESLSGLAPVSGTISKKYKKIGDEVSSGEAIYEIVDPNGAEIISFVPSSMAKLIKVGTPVLLSEQEYQVTEVASVPTGIGNKYEVRASVDGDKYQIGEYTTANFILTQPTGLWIPLSAIENRNNKSYIYQVDTQGGLSRYEVFIEKFASNQALLRADELLESKQILRYAKGISINTIIDLNGK